MFEYQASWYPQRTSALAAIMDGVVPATTVCRRFGIEPAVAYTAAGIDCVELTSPPAHSMVRDLIRRRVVSHGLRLDTVYLAILEYCLALVQDDRAHAFDSRIIRHELYLDGNKKRPLLVADEVGAIVALLDSLDVLVNAPEVRAFRIFGMTGPNIIRGRRSMTDAWTTLLAYCGGKMGSEGKCRRSPLVLGRQLPCECCCKLVCDRCGYCWDRCPNCESRQKEMLAARLAQRRLTGAKGRSGAESESPTDPWE
jgi:hypothetical protein